MPEIAIGDPALVKDIRSKELEHQRNLEAPISSPEWVEGVLAPLYPETRFLGMGAEAIVVANRDRPDKAIAFRYDNFERTDPITARRVFYAQRFFSTLFPHNFPHFYASIWGEKPQEVRQTIEVKPYDKQQVPTYPFERVFDDCDEMGITLRTDDWFSNFQRGADGGEYYMDNLPDSFLDNFYKLDENKLRVYLKKENITGSREKTIWRSLRRLRELEAARYVAGTLSSMGGPYEDWQDSARPHFEWEIFGFNSTPEDEISKGRAMNLAESIIQTQQRIQQSQAAIKAAV